MSCGGANLRCWRTALWCFRQGHCAGRLTPIAQNNSHAQITGHILLALYTTQTSLLSTPAGGPRRPSAHPSLLSPRLRTGLARHLAETAAPAQLAPTSAGLAHHRSFQGRYKVPADAPGAADVWKTPIHSLLLRLPLTASLRCPPVPTPAPSHSLRRTEPWRQLCSHRRKKSWRGPQRAPDMT